MWLRLWLVGVFGAHVGAGTGFFLESVRRDVEGIGTGDDVTLWLLLTLALAGVAAGAVALTGVPVTAGAVAVLAGATLTAVVPVDYRTPGELTEWGLGAILVSPMVVVTAVVVASCWRARKVR